MLMTPGVVVAFPETDSQEPPVEVLALNEKGSVAPGLVTVS